MNRNLLVMTAPATGLPVVVFVSRIVAIAARPKLDVRGKPGLLDGEPQEDGCSIALDGVSEPLFIKESFDDVVGALTRMEV